MKWGGGGSGGIDVWGRGWQSGQVNRLIVLGVGISRGEVRPVQQQEETAKCGSQARSTGSLS